MTRNESEERVPYSNGFGSIFSRTKQNNSQHDEPPSIKNRMYNILSLTY
jgi:hypothetical protein